MLSMNKHILIGGIGRDPEPIRFPDGNQNVVLTVATSESWRDRNTGEWQERTEWHRVIAKGHNAEYALAHLRKGDLIRVEGPSKTRKWKDRDGVERPVTEIDCEVLRLFMRRSPKPQGDSSATPEPSRHASQMQRQGTTPGTADEFHEDPFPTGDDPFSLKF